MKSEIRYRPAFATIFLDLEPGDTVLAEAGAMASMSSSIQMSTRFNGGLFRGLARKMGGSESLFVNEFSAPAAGGQLVLTQDMPGDMVELDLQNETMYLQPGAYIASAGGVKLGVGWAGFSSWFGGEGLFRLKLSGSGTVWFGAYGGIYEREISGEYVVDTSHLVGYTPGLDLKVGRAGGLLTSFFSGEGFVTRIRGEGKLWLQSRSFGGLSAWTNAHIW